MFDLTISMGNLLQIGAMVVGGLFFLYRMEARLIILSTIQDNFVSRVSNLELEVKKLAEVTIDLARQNERMTALDLRMTTLASRLDAYIKPSQRSKG